MSSPLHHWPSRHSAKSTGRHLTITTVIWLAGAAAVSGISTGSASAHSVLPCRASFATSSAADLVALRSLDLTPLGLESPNIAFPYPLLGSTRAGFYGGQEPQTAARAGMPVRGGYVLQTAPTNSNNTAATLRVEPTDTDTIHSGAQYLQTTAVLDNSATCGDAINPRATAALDLYDETTFIGDGIDVLQISDTSKTSTNASLVHNSTEYAAVAESKSELTSIRLFNTVTIHMTGPASLRVIATGTIETSAITYSPPSIAVSTAATAGDFQPFSGELNLIAPLGPTGMTAATALAQQTGAPLLPAPTFDSILATVGVDHGTYSPHGKIAIIRLSVEPIAQHNLGWRVHALASALHVQILLRTGEDDGTTRDSPLADITIGSLEALACAPAESDSQQPSKAATASTDKPKGSRDNTPLPAAHALQELAFDPLGQPLSSTTDSRQPAGARPRAGTHNAISPNTRAESASRRSRFPLIVLAGLALISAGRLAKGLSVRG